MMLTRIIEEALIIEEELNRIFLFCVNASEMPEIQRRIIQIASNTVNSSASVAAAIADNIATGMTAEQAIHKMEIKIGIGKES